MKKIISHLPKKVLMTLAGIVAIVGIAVGVQAAFGPDRQTFTGANPAPYITFNSITDNPIIGDERAFLRGALPGASSYTDPVADAVDGQEITIEMFVHNDAAADLDLVAHNTTVKVAIPQGSQQGHQVTGYVSASNAQPTEVWDTLDIRAQDNGFFELEYVPGSATWKNNHFTSGTTLPDSIVTTGALIGNTSLNGDIPGCAEFSGWVTLRVKVNMPHYVIQKSVRLAGENSDRWRESANANALTDDIEWRVEFRNIGSTQLDNVIVIDQIPTYMEVIPGTVQLINSNHPADDPYVYSDSEAIQYKDGKTYIHVNAGDYLPNSNGFIRFSTRLVDSGEDFPCGNSRLTNQSFATPGGYGSVSSYAYVVFTKPCDQPVYSCDNLNVTAYEDRSIEASIETTQLNGVAYKDMNIDFGDGTEPFVTDGKIADYVYDEDGTYTIRATAGFMVDGEYKTDNGPQCTKTVTFEGGEPYIPEYPGELPSTGVGGIAGIFAATSAIGTLGYRFWAIRRK